MKQTIIAKDEANKKLLVEREFDAPVEKVWRAWTESEILDKWWAPKPWRAVTKMFDFSDGGMWLYNMLGPDGTGQWCRVDFKNIEPGKSFSADTSFSDEYGVINMAFPQMHWKNDFSATATGSKVNVELAFDTLEAMEQIVAMGFKEGFSMGLGNLEELLAR